MFWKVIDRRIRRRRRHYSVIDFPFGIPLKAESGGTAKGGQTSLTIFGNQFNTLLSSCFVHVGLKICESEFYKRLPQPKIKSWVNKVIHW